MTVKLGKDEKMKTFTFGEEIPEEEGSLCLVDIETVPFHMRMDYAKRNQNVESGNILCEHCCGTGNELFSMYRKCPKCNGIGKE